MRQEPIQNRIVVIVGKPGSGKTLMASYLMSHYDRQYANFGIFYPDKERARNGIIRSIDEIDRIRFSNRQGIVWMDELGINGNSRRSSSDDNLELAKLPMLWRKKKVDILAIWQLLYSIDKYFRDLAEIIIEMRSFWRGKNLMFEATIYRGGTQCEAKDVLNVWEFDLIFWSNWTGIHYDTLERAILARKSKEDKPDEAPKYEDMMKHTVWFSFPEKWALAVS